ncbi:aspartate-semialdehyde dehydrogenase [soil metagenome]
MVNVAILGASGAVGQELLSILEQRQFPIGELRLLASERSAGRKFAFRGRLLEVQAVTPESFDNIQIGLFSAGGSISAKWAPIAAAKGCIVIDNTSHFRMKDDVDLIVPEVNGDLLKVKPRSGIIANPNCSTIQMVQVLAPLHKLWNIKRVVVATYQSVSGKGKNAMDELKAQMKAMANGDDPVTKVFPHQIGFNLLPHIGSFMENGYTDEEMKMVNETRKIMRAPGVRVSATCVRVPVYRSHSESVNIEFEKPVDVAKAREVLSKTENVILVDDVAGNHYPMPIYADGKDETHVGRIRKDISNPDGTGLDLWVVSDNLRTGAALNAIRIAEILVKNGVVKN